MENLTASEELSFMARIRSIKPDFWTDEKIVTLSPLARLLFIGMWNFVDDYGRAEYSPLRLKMQILPADSADISEILGEIRGKKLIQVYEVDNKEYFEVTGFTKHQKIDKRTASKIPNPPLLSTISPESPRIPSTEVDKERKGKERNKETTSVSRDKIAFDRSSGKFLNISDEHLEIWKEAYPAIALPIEIGKAAAWLHANPKNKKSNYERFLANWFSRAQDKAPATSGRKQAGGMAPTSAEKNGEEYDRLGYLRFMSDKMKRWKLKMEGESFRRDLIEIGDDPAKYEGVEDAEH